MSRLHHTLPFVVWPLLAGLHAAASAAPAAGAASAAAVESAVELVVQPGDTLIGLLRPGADWRAVQRSNRVADPRRLRPGSTLRFPPGWLREQPVQADVVHAYGDVVLQRAGQDARPLQGGDTLAAGDRLTSGAQSSALLRFVDGSTLLLRPGSGLRIERLAQGRGGASTALQLERGSADSRVPPAAAGPAGGRPAAVRRYEIGTPHANLGVRGTEFRSRVDQDATRVEVLEGVVGARRGAHELPVEAGFGAVAAGNGEAGLDRQALPAAPDLGGLPAQVERLPLRLGWAGAAPGTQFRAQVYDRAEPPRLVLDGRFDAPLARWSEDLPDGPYELRVRSLGAGGLEGRDARAGFVLAARPEPPFLSAPAADARTGDDSVRFAWTRNAAAARARLQIATTPDFATPLVDRADLEAAELRVELAPGSYHWRMASVRADGSPGPFGDAQALTRVALPAAPAPAEGTLGDDALALRWPAGDRPGLRWQVQVARDAAFTHLLRDETVAEPHIALARTEPGEVFVRVKAIDADGFAGPFGQPQRLDVPAPRSYWWLWLLLPLLFVLP